MAVATLRIPAARTSGSWLQRLVMSLQRGATGRTQRAQMPAHTAREHRMLDLYHATGVHRGERPDSGAVIYDLVDRYRYNGM